MKRLLFIVTLLLTGNIFGATPTIRVDSSNPSSSDIFASGAGPDPAITSLGIATDATGLIVTLSGSPDLVNVATDGTHVVYLDGVTTNQQAFGRILGKDGSLTSTATVTVGQAFSLSMSSPSVRWAIGGFRATFNSTSTRHLFSGSIDARPNWTILMSTGHRETITSIIQFPGIGDITGYVTLMGPDNASSMPILTCTANTGCLANTSTGFYYKFRNFEMWNTNATKTASAGISSTVGASSIYMEIDNVKISSATAAFWRPLNLISSGIRVINSELGYGTGDCVNISNNTSYLINNYIHDCAGRGVNINGGAIGPSTIEGNIIANNTLEGIIDSRTDTGRQLVANRIAYNDIYNNGGDGYESTMTGSQSGLSNLIFINNNITNNSGYGINFSGGATESQILGLNAMFYNNNFFSNTSGTIFPSTYTVLKNSLSIDPQYSNPSGGDYTIGTNLVNQGWPGINFPVGRTSTYSYPDIGAAQRQGSSGSGISGDTNTFYNSTIIGSIIQ